MALKQNKQLKLYYSIKEVAEMFGVNIGKRNFPPSLRNGLEGKSGNIRKKISKISGRCIIW